MAGRAAGEQGHGGGVEGGAGGGGIRGGDDKLHAGGGEPVFPLPALGRAADQNDADPAADFPQPGAGAEPGGVYAAAGDGAGAGEGAAGAADGDHVRHGHPGVGGEVHHGGGGADGTGGDRAEGEDPHHTAAGEAVPQAVEIREKTKDRHWGDLSHQVRQGAVAAADMGGDEGAVRTGRGGGVQGVSPQPAPPVCPDLLPGVPGRGAAGGRAGPFQRGNHPDLPGLHRGGVRPAHGPAGACLLGGISQNKHFAVCHTKMKQRFNKFSASHFILLQA